MAEIPTFQEQPAIDRDEDGTISEREHEQYLASLLKSLGSNLHHPLLCGFLGGLGWVAISIIMENCASK